jgi:hypothetical protein
MLLCTCSAAAGEEGDADIGGAPQIDGQTAQRDDIAGAGLNDDGGAGGAGPKNGRLDPVGDDADRLGDGQRPRLPAERTLITPLALVCP